MKVAALKSLIAAITGLAGSLVAAFHGYANTMAIVGFGTFIVTLAIQYFSIKVKIGVPLIAALAYFSYLIYGGNHG
jgi:hypothetical protein